MAKKKNYFRIMRASIIIIPIILSILFLFNPYEKIPLTREQITENLTMIRVSEEEIFKPSFKNTLRDIFEVPFDLKWYDICFVNNDTQFIYEIGDADKTVNVSLTFNNASMHNIPYGETKCITYRFNKDFTYRWKFVSEIHVNIDKLNMTEYCQPVDDTTRYCRKRAEIGRWHRSVDSYAKPEFWSILAKIGLISIAWSALVLLFVEVLNFIRGDGKRKTKD